MIKKHPPSFRDDTNQGDSWQLQDGATKQASRSTDAAEILIVFAWPSDTRFGQQIQSEPSVPCHTNTSRTAAIANTASMLS
jgi:hypothetical protein